jgi:S1-C subfamily serine protease
MLGPDGAPNGAGSSRSPAESPPTRAGLRAGDVIQSAGQERTPDTQALSRALAAAQPGEQVTLTVARGTEHLTVQVTLGELPGS